MPFIRKSITVPRNVFPSWFVGLLVVAGSAADSHVVAGREWKPVEQPNLAAALDAAPPLAFEDLADGPDTCWQGPLWWVPNPDGKTWDFVFIYYPSYSGPNEAFIYDTGTKQVTKARCPELAAVPARFHLHRPLLFGGKVHLVGGERTPNVFVYDPATHEGAFLGEGGPPNPAYQWEYRGVVTDGDWIYGRVGHSPWRLLGMNAKTRQGKVIVETERFVGDRDTIQFQRHPDYPGVHVTITGVKGGPKDKTHTFWLRDGELTPCEPAPRNAAPVPPGGVTKLPRPRLGRGIAFDENDPPPRGLQMVRGGVDRDGKVVSWYRFTDPAMAAANGVEPGAWQRIELPPVTLHPAAIARLVALSDGSLFAVAPGYGRAVTFHPATGKRTGLGETMSIYAMLPLGEKLYLCGYSGSMVWVYDPAQPWTAGKALDAPPAAADDPDVVPPRGKLFVYDTTTHEFLHEVDDERLGQYPGFITEALPGLVMGYTPARDAAGVETGLLYGFDPAAGTVQWTKPVPRPPATGFSATKHGRHAFTKGPDGFIWATMDGVLARIDPHTAGVSPVGKMGDAPIAFVDGDVYVGGAPKFRRIVLPTHVRTAP